MPNKNYRRGVAIERKVKDELENIGYTVIRAAGSHGLWDIVAVNQNEATAPVRCIQVKRTATLLGAKRLLAKLQHPNLPSGFQAYTHEVWIWVDRKGWYHELTGEEHLTNIPKK